MLKHRLLTALVVAPLFIFAILSLPMTWFVLFCSVILLGCAWEWSALSGLLSFRARILYVLLFFLLLGLIFVFNVKVVALFFLGVELIFYMAVPLWVLAFGELLAYSKNKSVFGLKFKIVKLIIGFCFLLAFWCSLIQLQGHSLAGLNALLCGFLLVWMVDIGAYTAGRLFGSHKLCPQISPNKTWEGFIGGLLSCVFIAMFIAAVLHFTRVQFWSFVLLAFVTGLFAVLGDLCESMFKRQVGLKDSGSILPGHGGLLDRFDSSIAALPVFLLGLAYFVRP